MCWITVSSLSELYFRDLAMLPKDLFVWFSKQAPSPWSFRPASFNRVSNRVAHFFKNFSAQAIFLAHLKELVSLSILSTQSPLYDFRKVLFRVLEIRRIFGNFEKFRLFGQNTGSKIAITFDTVLSEKRCGYQNDRLDEFFWNMYKYGTVPLLSSCVWIASGQVQLACVEQVLG